MCKIDTMFHSIKLTDTNAWKQLLDHHEANRDLTIQSLFTKDTDRFNEFSLEVGDGFLVDYSKNRLTSETLAHLISLAKECKLNEAITAMYSGEKINATEDRAVLHIALRDQSKSSIIVDGHDIQPLVKEELRKMESFCKQFHAGELKGFTGKALKNIVNIGIGGSDLGPVMVTEALKPYWIDGVQTFFVSNVDGTHIAEVLKKVKAEETLFIIASKSFTTQETMRNAKTAQQWFLSQGGNQSDIAKHFIALSTNESGVANFGIDTNNMFQFWDWVGGRFSLTSAIGMSIALTIGFSNFTELLDGFHEMDVHFKSADYRKNAPVLLALIGIWNTNFLGAESEALLPYDQYLHRFAAYFQQANMESNGKFVDRNGEKVNYQTGPIVWGEPGTNGQHAFYQLIHQGTRLIPCDFIASAQSHNPKENHQQLLLSNFFAQTEALMNGKTKDEVIADYKAKGLSIEEVKDIIPFKEFEGNRPTNSILLKKLSPHSLGKLIAMYEHKIFVQGVIWNIYSFDQWGVQLGKELANKIAPELDGNDTITSHDSSTNGLINQFKAWR